jgi:UDP-N-acetylglucosamine 1-carboxyvinyltransferase
MGARIQGAGSDVVTVDGVEELEGFDHPVMPDRIEAGTYLAAAALTGSRLTLTGAWPGSMDAVLAKFREAGVMIAAGEDSLSVDATAGRLRAVDCVTAPYPGFPTDMQAQLLAAMCLAQGTSVITETIFENRFMHVQELSRLGADIQVKGNQAVVRGVERLSGAPLMATDLRASAGLVVAGLAAQGQTVVRRVYHLDRGYEALDAKLAQAGARIWREKDD